MNGFYFELSKEFGVGGVWSYKARENTAMFVRSRYPVNMADAKIRRSNGSRGKMTERGGGKRITKGGKIEAILRAEGAQAGDNAQYVANFF